MNVEVATTDAGADRICTEVNRCLRGIQQDYGTQAVSRHMIECCHKYADQIIEDFAERNREGETEAIVLVEKWVHEPRGAHWTKECQISVEIDADGANANTGQTGHLGCEMYFAQKGAFAVEDKNTELWRLGKPKLKVHAYLANGQDPPHVRHEGTSQGPDPFMETPRTTPEQRNVGRDLHIMYRCSVTRRGYPQ